MFFYVKDSNNSMEREVLMKNVHATLDKVDGIYGKILGGGGAGVELEEGWCLCVTMTTEFPARRQEAALTLGDQNAAFLGTLSTPKNKLQARVHIRAGSLCFCSESSDHVASNGEWVILSFLWSLFLSLISAMYICTICTYG